MNQDNGMQKRMIIMTVIVFVFFLAYEFLVLKPQQEAKAAQVNQEKVAQQKATPDVNMVATDVSGNPIDMSKSVEALSSKAVASTEVISVIKTRENTIEIDKFGRIAQITLQEKKYIDEDQHQIKLYEANQLRPLEVRFEDRNINEKAFKIAAIASATTLDASTSTQNLTITQDLGETVLTKKFTIYPDGHYDFYKYYKQ